MTKRAAFGLILCLLSRGAAAAKSTDPDWDYKPSETEIERFYPQTAKKLGKEGRVVLNCSVSAQGRAHDCRVMEEVPQGLEFGEAGIRIMAKATFKPATEMGHPIEAKRPISVPIIFKLSAASQNDSREDLLFGALLFVGFGIQVVQAFVWGVVSGRTGGEAQRGRSPALFWLGTIIYAFVSAMGLAVVLTTFGLPDWAAFGLSAVLALFAIVVIRKKPRPNGSIGQSQLSREHDLECGARQARQRCNISPERTSDMRTIRPRPRQ